MDLPILDILIHYSVNVLNDNGEYIHCQCPLHTGTGKSPLNFGIHCTTGRWKCFAKCGSGDIYDLVSRLEHCTLEEAQTIVSKYITEEMQLERIKKLYIDRPRLKDFIEVETRKDLNPIPEQHPYIINKRIPVDIARSFNVQVDPLNLRVYFPIVFENKLLGYSSRANNNVFTKVWKHDTNLPKSRVLYNFDNAVKKPYVIVVEGITDAIYLYSMGFTSTVATLGTGVSAAQRNLLIGNWNEIIIMFDGDDAGRTEANKLAKNLYRHVDKIIVTDLPDGKDPDDLDDPEDIYKLIDNGTLMINEKEVKDTWKRLRNSLKKLK